MRPALAAARVAAPLLLSLAAAGTSADTGDLAAANARLVREAFEYWRQGRGSVFELLHADVVWTVAGASPVSGTYASRQEFLDRAVQPINARLATPITPVVRHLVAQEDAVVVLWEGSATTREGGGYANHYAWHMEFADGKVVRVTAFLDTWALDRLMDGSPGSP